MMIAEAFDSLLQIFSPPFRRVMWKSFALTISILAAAAIGLDRLALSLMHVGPSWLATLLSVALALGLTAGMIFLAAPAVALVGSFFLDDIAATVEREIDPDGPPGRALPLAQSIAIGVRFTLLAVLANTVALALTVLTGVGVASFFILNGYLFGREYFELAAMRQLPPPQARALRRRHRGQVFLAGGIISAFVAVPILNLLAPLFATAFMARLYKRLSPPGEAGSAQTRHF